jgi:hypothetical protein
VKLLSTSQDSEMLSLDFHLHNGLPRLAADLVSPGLVKGVCRAFTGRPSK